eukprot:gnl/TRDRNA2_/TRDRNA2_186302_c0_seq1.p1 gnl/TRDRNA2_/TRDRNA2_186302_c0~~gnl/TRDRNA2_/TRDRNA2_186302_c0_seq1.p1  ORF type:complete len:625 (-),score=82.58 gnl/TRDRNA2_/TRDRNA2_186302_c0_seq1:104-1978(-)
MASSLKQPLLPDTEAQATASTGSASLHMPMVLPTKAPAERAVAFRDDESVVTASNADESTPLPPGSPKSPKSPKRRNSDSNLVVSTISGYGDFHHPLSENRQTWFRSFTTRWGNRNAEDASDDGGQSGKPMRHGPKFCKENYTKTHRLSNIKLDQATTNHIGFERASSFTTGIMSRVLQAAVFKDQAAELRACPEFHGRHSRILDRSAPCRQSTGKFRVWRVNMAHGHFIEDIFHTVLEMSTGSLIFYFVWVYTLTFMFFALFWWCSGAGCNTGVATYMDGLFLSIETMTTIGYGVPDQYFTDCPWLCALLVVQVFTGILYDATLIGIVYQRVSRGTSRATTVLFSDKAVLKTIDGENYLMFQVCEMRRTELLESHIRCYLLSNNKKAPQDAPPGLAGTREQWTTIKQQPMRLERPDDSLGGQVLLVLPQVIVHRIDAWSPLWTGSATAKATREAQGLAEPSDAMARHTVVDLSPGQRQSECEAGCRDSVWCRACGCSYQFQQQLRKHIEFCVEQGKSTPGGDPRHEALLRDSMQELSAQTVREAVTDRMEKAEIEVVAVLEGIDATTSASVQARHSWTADDMVWDQDFEPCVRTPNNGGICVDFSKFHNLIPQHAARHTWTMP